MNLESISREIVTEVQFRSRFVNENFDTISSKVEKMLKKHFSRDIDELNNPYKKGQFYENLGIYIGLVDTYPFGEKYFLRNYHFSVPTKNKKEASKINQIFLRKILK